MSEDISLKKVFLDFCEKRSNEVALNLEEKKYLIESAINIYESIIEKEIWSTSLFDVMFLSNVWEFASLSEKMRQEYRIYFWRPYYLAPRGLMLESEIKKCLRFGFEFCDASDLDLYDYDEEYEWLRVEGQEEEYYWKKFEEK